LQKITDSPPPLFKRKEKVKSGTVKKGDCIVKCGNGDEERVQAGWVDSNHLAALDALLNQYAEC